MVRNANVLITQRSYGRLRRYRCTVGRSLSLSRIDVFLARLPTNETATIERENEWRRTRFLRYARLMRTRTVAHAGLFSSLRPASRHKLTTHAARVVALQHTPADEINSYRLYCLLFVAPASKSRFPTVAFTPAVVQTIPDSSSNLSPTC